MNHSYSVGPYSDAYAPPHDIRALAHHDRLAAGLRRAAWWCFASGVVAHVLLSAPSLFYLGIMYDAPGGSVLEKIHPGIWLVLLADVLMLASQGNPLRLAVSRLGEDPLLGTYVVFQTMTVAWLVLRHGGAGAINVFGTLILPYFCVWLIGKLDARRQHRLLAIIVGLLVVNTLIGIAESIVQVKFIPFRMGGKQESLEDFFRPSALLGHPLTNSMVTAILLPAPLYLRIAMAWRVGLMVLLWVGTITFGGRTGFVLSTLAYGLYFPAWLALKAVRGRFTYLQLTGGAVGAVLIIIVVAMVVLSTGIGERIFQTLVWDGSANVRVQVWRVFDYISDQDLMTGVSPSTIIAIGTTMGLGDTEAIENFWLVLLLQTGWLAFPVFLIGILCAFAWMWRESSGSMRVAVLLFIAIGSSNNSLATKTPVMLLFMSVLAIARARPFSR